MVTFNKVKLTIDRAIGYGQYIITAIYKGKEIKARTTNSQCFDWLEDDSNKAKHKEAKRYAYKKIVEAYNESCM